MNILVNFHFSQLDSLANLVKIKHLMQLKLSRFTVHNSLGLYIIFIYCFSRPQILTFDADPVQCDDLSYASFRGENLTNIDAQNVRENCPAAKPTTAKPTVTTNAGNHQRYAASGVLMALGTFLLVILG